MPFPPNTLPPDDPAAGPTEPGDAHLAPPTFLPELLHLEAPALTGFRRFERPAPPRWRTYLLHSFLFGLTLLTTTLAGVQLTRGSLDLLPLGVGGLPAAPQPSEWARGLWFALLFLGVLTVHEFGHYFTARANRVRATLPFFIPFPMGLGTFGAVIRIKDKIFSRREFFDIGLAGPLAGFVVAVPLLVYGFATLPPLADYLFQIHPEYARYGASYAQYVYGPEASQSGIALARPLLYRLLETLVADPARVPHPLELLHFPVLLAGALALFFTALNLLPIGQLDGGHILYGLLGNRRFNRLATWLFTAFIFYAGLGLFTLRDGWKSWLYFGPVYALYLGAVFWRALPTPRRGLLLAAAVWAAQLAVAAAWPAASGNPGWLLFGLLLGRLTGIHHPPAPDERPLSPGRQVLGWAMVAVFVLCFTPSPFR